MDSRCRAQERGYNGPYDTSLQATMMTTLTDVSNAARPRRFALRKQWLLLSIALLTAALVAWESSALLNTLRYRPLEAGASEIPQEAGAYAARIADANWFGQAQPAEPVTSGGVIPESDLALTLRAVFVSGGTASASAIVESADGRTEVVREGGEIAPGATLREVHDDRVVILRNGSSEQLFFPSAGEASLIADAQLSTRSAHDPAAAPATDTDISDEDKRANILRRLEELRARGAG